MFQLLCRGWWRRVGGGGDVVVVVVVLWEGEGEEAAGATYLGTSLRHLGNSPKSQGTNIILLRPSIVGKGRKGEGRAGIGRLEVAGRSPTAWC